MNNDGLNVKLLRSFDKNLISIGLLFKLKQLIVSNKIAEIDTYIDTLNKIIDNPDDETYNSNNTNIIKDVLDMLIESFDTSLVSQFEDDQNFTIIASINFLYIMSSYRDAACALALKAEKDYVVMIKMLRLDNIKHHLLQTLGSNRLNFQLKNTFLQQHQSIDVNSIVIINELCNKLINDSVINDYFYNQLKTIALSSLGLKKSFGPIHCLSRPYDRYVYNHVGADYLGNTAILTTNTVKSNEHSFFKTACGDDDDDTDDETDSDEETYRDKKIKLERIDEDDEPTSSTDNKLTLFDPKFISTEDTQELENLLNELKDQFKNDFKKFQTKISNVLSNSTDELDLDSTDIKVQLQNSKIIKMRVVELINENISQGLLVLKNWITKYHEITNSGGGMSNQSIEDFINVDLMNEQRTKLNSTKDFLKQFPILLQASNLTKKAFDQYQVYIAQYDFFYKTLSVLKNLLATLYKIEFTKLKFDDMYILQCVPINFFIEYNSWPLNSPDLLGNVNQLQQLLLTNNLFLVLNTFVLSPIECVVLKNTNSKFGNELFNNAEMITKFSNDHLGAYENIFSLMSLVLYKVLDEYNTINVTPAASTASSFTNLVLKQNKDLKKYYFTNITNLTNEEKADVLQTLSTFIPNKSGQLNSSILISLLLNFIEPLIIIQSVLDKTDTSFVNTLKLIESLVTIKPIPPATGDVECYLPLNVVLVTKLLVIASVCALKSIPTIRGGELVIAITDAKLHQLWKILMRTPDQSSVNIIENGNKIIIKLVSHQSSRKMDEFIVTDEFVKAQMASVEIMDIYKYLKLKNSTTNTPPLGHAKIRYSRASYNHPDFTIEPGLNPIEKLLILAMNNSVTNSNIDIKTVYTQILDDPTSGFMFDHLQHEIITKTTIECSI